jgi:hypothetical protein
MEALVGQNAVCYTTPYMGMENSSEEPNRALGPDISIRLHSWFLEHRFQLRKWWVILILSADTLLIVYLVIAILMSSIQNPAYDRMVVRMAEVVAPSEAVTSIQTVPLETRTAAALPNGSGTTDCVGFVINPNSDWLAHITYHFEFSGTTTAAQSASVFPNQSRYVSSLGQTGTVPTSTDATIVLETVSWERVLDRTMIENTRFDVIGTTYQPSVIVPNSPQRFAQVQATVKNSSLYGFWTITIPIVLLQGDHPVAVQEVVLRGFRPGESRPISAQWFTTLPEQLTVDIRPQVDITDQGNIMSAG